MKSPRFLLLAASALAVAILAHDKQNQYPPSRSDEGFGQDKPLVTTQQLWNAIVNSQLSGRTLTRIVLKSPLRRSFSQKSHAGGVKRCGRIIW